MYQDVRVKRQVNRVWENDINENIFFCYEERWVNKEEEEWNISMRWARWRRKRRISLWYECEDEWKWRNRKRSSGDGSGGGGEACNGWKWELMHLFPIIRQKWRKGTSGGSGGWECDKSKWSIRWRWKRLGKIKKIHTHFSRLRGNNKSRWRSETSCGSGGENALNWFINEGPVFVLVRVHSSLISFKLNELRHKRARGEQRWGREEEEREQEQKVMQGRREQDQRRKTKRWGEEN